VPKGRDVGVRAATKSSCSLTWTCAIASDISEKSKTIAKNFALAGVLQHCDSCLFKAKTETFYIGAV